jgi:hypothetical protein
LRQSLRIGGGGRARVPNAHPTRGGPSCTVPACRLRVTGPLEAIAVTPCQRPGGRRGPKRWIGKSVHRGQCRASLKHRARDVGEKTDLRSHQSDGGPAGFAVLPRPRERPGPVGPFGPPASRAALTCGGAIWNEARARRRDNGQAERWLKLCHSGAARSARPGIQSGGPGAIDPGFRVRELRSRPGMTAERECKQC